MNTYRISNLMKLNRIRLKLFRFFLNGLCRLFGYDGVIYKVNWNVDIAGLIERGDKQIAVMNNTMKPKNMHARLRPMRKGDRLLDDVSGQDA